jgi:signal peptidase I
MAPTLEEGDEVLTDTTYFRRQSPKDGDVVVFRHHGIYLVKRIVAMPGEKVSSANGQIAINGMPVEEPFAHHTGEAPPEANTFPAIVVPAGQLFVLGDNRDESLDSRFQTQENNFGTVTLDDLAGVPLYLIRSKRTGQAVK